MKNLLLNTLLIVLTLFALTNCEQNPFDTEDQTRAQWGNSEGRWSDANLDCSGNASRCLPVIIVHGIAAPHTGVIDGLNNGATGAGSSQFVSDYFDKEEVIDLFTNLNEYQLGLLQSGEYSLKTFYFDKDRYEHFKTGRIKYFAAKNEVVNDPVATLEDYEFSFEVDIRE